MDFTVYDGKFFTNQEKKNKDYKLVENSTIGEISKNTG